MGDYFAIEADIMIDIVRMTRIKIVLINYLYLIGIFSKLSPLDENYYFLFICLYILRL